jgi:hypothetical protein
VNWIRAAACKADKGMCLEATAAGEAVLLRATEQPDEVIAVTRDEFRTFIEAAQRGEFNGLAGIAGTTGPAINVPAAGLT